MPRSPGPLQQPRDTFGGTNLDDLIHRREVHPKVQAGGADHAPESAVFTFQHRFHTISKLPFQGAVVQGNFSEQVRRCQNQRAVPNLGLGPGARDIVDGELTVKSFRRGKSLDKGVRGLAETPAP